MFLYESCMMFGECLTVVDYPIDLTMTPYYTPDMLDCYAACWNQELEPWTSSVVSWSKDEDTCIDILCHCF